MRSTSLIALAQVAVAAESLTPRIVDENHTACQKIDNAIWSQEAVSPSAAYGCLKSFAYDKEKGKQLVDEIGKYLEFYSLLDALVSPPDGFDGGQINMKESLSTVLSKNWQSHSEFELAVDDVFRLTNDGHVRIQTCLNGLMSFRCSNGLVSVSSDGVSIPEIFLLDDIIGKGESSPVTNIGYQPVTDALEDQSKLQSFQDADARWNSLFASLAADVVDPSSRLGAFANDRGRWVDDTTVDFKNATSYNISSTVTMDSYKPAEDIWRVHCLPKKSDSSNSSSSSSKRRSDGGSQPHETSPPSAAQSGPQGYPEPQFRDTYNEIVGYYLDEETAVMFVPTFISGPGVPANHSLVFSKTAQTIVDDAVATGRTKIIIDVSRNGGGDVVRAFDLFKLFFPDEFPYSATRFRRHDAANLISKIIGDVVDKNSREDAGGMGWSLQVSPDQKEGFKTFDDFLGSESQLNTPVSAPFANFNISAFSVVPNRPIRGYGDAANLLNKNQPFKPENILIVGDGACSSSCTTFVNLMTNVGGVRTVAFGGRHQTGPMQIMGGVRGGQSMSFDTIDTNAAVARQLVKDGNYTATDAEKKVIKDSFPMPLKELPLQILDGNVNFRNAYQEGHLDSPLQFEFQAADCRRFFTAENIVNPATIWADAKAAIWGSGKCVADSTGKKGSREYAKDHPDPKNDDKSNGSGKKNEKNDSSMPSIPIFNGVTLMLAVSFIHIML